MSNSSYPKEYLVKLHDNLVSLSVVDLQECCFKLGVNYDDLQTQTTALGEKAQALIIHLAKRGQLESLAKWGKKEFPNLSWDPDPPGSETAQSQPATSLAVARQPLRAFIGYSLEDGYFARKLYDYLESLGAEPWLDEKRILPGANRIQKINQAINNSDVVLVCLSSRSFNAEGQLKYEIQQVLDTADAQPLGSILVIPLRLDHCTVPDWLVRYRQPVDFSDEFDGSGLDKLRLALHEYALRSGKTLSADNTKRDTTSSDTPQATSDTSGCALVVAVVVLVAFAVFLLSSLRGTRERSDATTLVSNYKPRLSFELAPNVQMDFVLIPAETFIMGSNSSLDGDARHDEQPQHRVYLSDYYIGIYEVTNRQYAVFAKETGLNFALMAGREDHPVTNISWNDANTFSAWLSRKIGRIVSLPTEAQWEKACRGTDGRIYPWGNEFDIQKLNSAENGVKDTTRVSSYSPRGDSPYGISDMSGNVWEWTQDWYSDKEYSRSSITQPITNPTGPQTGIARVLRGGALAQDRIHARCAARFGYTPDYRSPYYGFRVVLRP
jgi:formylglycine-generating enzyme required for sulfatase activity